MKRFIYFLFFLPICLSANTSTIYLYSHGLASNKSQAFWYTKRYKRGNAILENENYLINGPVQTFDFPDALGVLAKLCRVNFTQTSFGQDNELNAFIRAYKQVVARLEEKAPENSGSAVVVAMSRGAVVALIALAKYQLTKVKFAVLESPFDSLESVIDKRFTNPYARATAYQFLRCNMPFFKYNRMGNKPINVVESVDKNVPLLLVCSQQDTTVPYECTVNLYKKLRECGHEHAYLLVLKHGKHAHLLSGKDGETYQNVVHALYKKYGLKHDADSAAKGEQFLPNCQPNT